VDFTGARDSEWQLQQLDCVLHLPKPIVKFGKHSNARNKQFLMEIRTELHGARELYLKAHRPESLGIDQLMDRLTDFRVRLSKGTWHPAFYTTQWTDGTCRGSLSVCGRRCSLCWCRCEQSSLASGRDGRLSRDSIMLQSVSRRSSICRSQ